jgi:hypothetical protein
MPMGAPIRQSNRAAIGRSIEQDRLTEYRAGKKHILPDLVTPRGNIPAISDK